MTTTKKLCWRCGRPAVTTVASAPPSAPYCSHHLPHHVLQFRQIALALMHRGMEARKKRLTVQGVKA